MKNGTHLPLATDKARYQGDGSPSSSPRAAHSRKDAAELVQVDYEPLPAAVDVEAAAQGRRTARPRRARHQRQLRLEARGRRGRRGIRERRRDREGALLPPALDPERDRAAEHRRAAEPGNGRRDHVVGDADPAHPATPRCRDARHARVEASRRRSRCRRRLRIQAGRVRRGAASRSRSHDGSARPVKWTEERSEGYLATIHGRDVVQEMEYAADGDGKITAVRVSLTASMGAYLQLVTPGIPLLGAWLYAGAYDIPAYSFTCTGVFTNTTPTDAYRGAGRPEATMAVERAIDALARKLDIDPVELRRRNFITEFPKTIASGLTIDAGDYQASLEKCLARARLRGGCGRSSRPGATAATRGCSASASRRTTRCAASRRRGSSARSGTPPVAGTRPRSAACRRGRSR